MGRTPEHEDEIYSLLGIFGVTMPLIYGEGKDRASRRLDDEISMLSKAPGFDKFGVDISLSRLPSSDCSVGGEDGADIWIGYGQCAGLGGDRLEWHRHTRCSRTVRLPCFEVA